MRIIPVLAEEHLVSQCKCETLHAWCRVSPSKWYFEECYVYLEIVGALMFYIFKADIHPWILK